MARFALESTKATKHRESILREEGVHMPPFLICSVTSRCNLHCASCYRAPIMRATRAHRRADTGACA